MVDNFATTRIYLVGGRMPAQESVSGGEGRRERQALRWLRAVTRMVTGTVDLERPTSVVAVIMPPTAGGATRRLQGFLI